MMVNALPSFLFINVSRIGDTMFSIPAMRAVANAYPGSALTALAHPRRADVLRELPFLAEVGTISKRTAWSRARLGGARYDVALVYGFDKPLVRYALRAARQVIAFRQNDPTLDQQLHRCVPVPPFQSEHAVLQCLRLPAALGVAPAGLRLSYRVLPAEAAEARARLAADVPPAATPLIGLQVASFPTKGYRDWPVAQFLELAQRIVRDWPHAHFLIYGGAEERERVQWLQQALTQRATLYAGRLTLRQTAAVMSLTDLYVGVDTGPTHLMSAFDIPLVGLYHCLSSSQHTGPLEHPCFYSVEHPRAPLNCNERAPMAEISLDAVLAAVSRALREHPPMPSRRGA